jgi:hypothetical protein
LHSQPELDLKGVDMGLDAAEIFIFNGSPEAIQPAQSPRLLPKQPTSGTSSDLKESAFL